MATALDVEALRAGVARGPADPARALLTQAGHGVLAARAERDAVARLALAHLAALRAAAAVLAHRASADPGGRGGPRSAWRLLARVAPELGEWAEFFAAAAPAAGSTVTERFADDMVRQVEQFIGLSRHLTRAGPVPTSRPAH